MFVEVVETELVGGAPAGRLVPLATAVFVATTMLVLVALVAVPELVLGAGALLDAAFVPGAALFCAWTGAGFFN